MNISDFFTLENLVSTVLSLVFMASMLIAVLIIGSTWKIFEKAGYKGWKSIIPIYNLYILYKISTGSSWLFLTTIIPVVDVVVYFIMCVKLGEAFGWSAMKSFFLIGLLPFIGLTDISTNNDIYSGPAPGVDYN